MRKNTKNNEILRGGRVLGEKGRVESKADGTTGGRKTFQKKRKKNLK